MLNEKKKKNQSNLLLDLTNKKKEISPKKKLQPITNSELNPIKNIVNNNNFHMNEVNNEENLMVDDKLNKRLNKFKERISWGHGKCDIFGKIRNAISQKTNETQQNKIAKTINPNTLEMKYENKSKVNLEPQKKNLNNDKENNFQNGSICISEHYEEMNKKLENRVTEQFLDNILNIPNERFNDDTEILGFFFHPDEDIIEKGINKMYSHRVSTFSWNDRKMNPLNSSYLQQSLSLEPHEVGGTNENFIKTKERLILKLKINKREWEEKTLCEPEGDWPVCYKHTLFLKQESDLNCQGFLVDNENGFALKAFFFEDEIEYESYSTGSENNKYKKIKYKHVSGQWPEKRFCLMCERYRVMSSLINSILNNKVVHSNLLIQNYRNLTGIKGEYMLCDTLNSVSRYRGLISPIIKHEIDKYKFEYKPSTLERGKKIKYYIQLYKKPEEEDDPLFRLAL